MLKRKKRKKSKGNFLEKTEEKVSDSKNIDLPNNIIVEEIRNAAAGLYYISETDAEILPFIGKSAESVGKETILSQTGSATDAPVEERDFASFFARLTEIQDWFGDEEIETAKRFIRLKELLEKNLRDLKVLKIGKNQLDIYVVGLNAENTLLGIKTKAVET